MAKYDFIIDESYTNPYMRLVRISDGTQWDSVSGVLSYTAVWANTAMALTANTYMGGIPVKIAVTLPAGSYNMLIYDAAVPASSDIVVKKRRIEWNGKLLNGVPQKT